MVGYEYLSTKERLEWLSTSNYHCFASFRCDVGNRFFTLNMNEIHHFDIYFIPLPHDEA